MSEFDEKNYPSTEALARTGMYALACIGGGVLLFLLQIFARFRILGLVLGGIVCMAGIVMLFSKDRTARRAGPLVITAGTLLLVSKIGLAFIRTIAGTVLIMGAVGLIIFGLWNGVKFIIGMKKIT